MRDGLKAFAVEVFCIGQPEIINRIVQHNHIDPLRPEGFKMWASHSHLCIFRRQIVDNLLPLSEILYILAKSCEAIIFGRLKEADLQNFCSVGLVLIKSFLNHLAKSVPEVFIIFAAVL